ncbi:Protein-S-isoprenylcysteine O-methyltransferase Ste14 [Collimonas sp. OK307]|uniref:methyltransferase family protein n=1 Tax=Collimonas sp. OK307 TaxID=1801620 RepID=UPI0008ECCD38|nr:isoprenylcysteine carboxylmethyltransferase family protein [Collimonas sp. OK307]SFI03423.1 Protein-S-isoprenylcysteine O-methyltransferase Ste14 [Collimonas sp. OK307]
MNRLNFREFRSSLLGAIVMALLLFVPAGTIDYWQGWLFMAVFVGATTAITVYLAIKDPKLLERRMSAGPTAEKEPVQKILMFFAMAGFIGLLVFPAFDHRFGWSPVPAYISLAAEVLILVSFFLVFIVLKVNTYAASTIQIAQGQKVISTGPYALVRHPMYAGALPLLIGMPLALGSWWGLFVLILFVPALIWRLLDEEKFLQKNLAGYADYCRKVRYRMAPFIW